MTYLLPPAEKWELRKQTTILNYNIAIYEVQGYRHFYTITIYRSSSGRIGMIVERDGELFIDTINPQYIRGLLDASGITPPGVLLESMPFTFSPLNLGPLIVGYVSDERPGIYKHYYFIGRVIRYNGPVTDDYALWKEGEMIKQYLRSLGITCSTPTLADCHSKHYKIHAVEVVDEDDEVFAEILLIHDDIFEDALTITGFGGDEEEKKRLREKIRRYFQLMYSD